MRGEVENGPVIASSTVAACKGMTLPQRKAKHSPLKI